MVDGVGQVSTVRSVLAADVLGPASGWLLAVAAVGCVLVTAVVTRRRARSRRGAVARVGGLVIAQALLLLALFVLANRQIQLYASWAELFGGST